MNIVAKIVKNKEFAKIWHKKSLTKPI